MSAARVEHLTGLAPHPGTAHHLAATVEGPVVLTLIGPGMEAHAVRVVQAYDLLVTHMEPAAHLIVAGALDLGAQVVLQELLRRSNLPAGWLAGPVDDDVLVAFLTRADVMVLPPDGPDPTSSSFLRDPAPDGDAGSRKNEMSDAAELALAFGLASVGGPRSVLGDAAVPLSATDAVAVWAEAIGALLARPSARRDLANRARRRAAERFALPA